MQKLISTIIFSDQIITASGEVDLLRITLDEDLLGITLDNRLNFETHISKLCRKAAGQLNALKRLIVYVHIETRKMIAEAFIFLLSTTARWYGIFQL